MQASCFSVQSVTASRILFRPEAFRASVPSKENVEALRSMEIGLISCQDYDLMRKRLMQWGLSENDLSEMSLVAIEQRAENLADVVQIHEIRY